MSFCKKISLLGDVFFIKLENRKWILQNVRIDNRGAERSSSLNSSKKLENSLVILLTMVSGCADAISFLALGEVLTAAMTGNTVFLGLSLVHANGLKPIGYLIALFGFMLGVAIAAIILRKKRHETGLNPIVVGAMGLELCAFIIFGILSSTNVTNHLLFVIVLSFAMGVQGTLARRIGVNGVPTTVITSTTTGLIESLVWNAFTKKKNNHSTTKSTTVPYSSILVWAFDIVIYGIGAALCGALELKWHLHAIWLPTVLIAIVLILSVAFQPRSQNQQQR
jgi:uncharacterized membrane protein YoaK (UPF0700 family)